MTISSGVDILDVYGNIQFDENITSVEYHTHFPYASTNFGYNDEIRIPFQQNDVLSLPSESYLHIEGVVQNAETADKQFDFNFNSAAFLFSEIRYELNGIELDRTSNLGITTTMKALLSMNNNNKLYYNAAGFSSTDVLQQTSKIVGNNVNFNVDIPVKFLLGFAEDYKKLIVYGRQELILKRERDDNNVLTARNLTLNIETLQPKPSIKLNTISWKIPYVKISDPVRVSLLNSLKQNKLINIAFRQWALFDYPTLPMSEECNWTVKMTSNLERPTCIILAFQTGRKHNLKQKASEFDNINLREFKVYLNSVYVPYENQNMNFTNNTNLSSPYYDFIKFASMYYGEEQPSSIISMEDYKSKYPLFVANLLYRNEEIKSGPVDIRIEFKTNQAIPASTSCYALLMHDKLYTYNPLTENIIKIF